mmetsp:Transcript_126722/g.354795  ORF Transcript_126722/g.354795 Transcript_126722/m.354795 type:complete len:214 (+) Transcript_126722:643-1284(+)
MPTVSAEVKLASHVRLTWNTRTKMPPARTATTPSGGSSERAAHQDGRKLAISATSPPWANRMSVPPSKAIASVKAVAELSANFSAVNSVAPMDPPNRLSGRNSSLAPARREETQSANISGVRRFTRSGTNGASMVCTACMAIITDPTVDKNAAVYSNTPCFSLFSKVAATTVQSKSLDCNNKWMPTGTNCKPQFVTPYLRPNNKPTGATCLNL